MKINTGTAIILGLAALAIYEYSQLGIAAQDVKFLFQGIQFNSINNIQVNLLVQNVSNAQIVLNAMSLDLAVNGNDLGNAAVFPQNPIVIQPASQQPIAVQITPDWLSLPSTIQTLLQGNISALDVTADGTANVNNIPVPVHVDSKIAA